MISLNINTEANISLNTYIINSINIFKYTPAELHKYVMDKCHANPLISIEDHHRFPNHIYNGDNFLEEVTTYFNCTLPAGELQVMDAIIASLSPKGFLEAAPEDIASMTGVPIRQVRHLIGLLQAYESKGAGSAGAVDFIEFQLKAEGSYNEQLFSAFKDHLPKVHSGDLNFLKALGIEEEVFLDYMENHIKTCRLYPLDGEASMEIVPEGFIRQDGDILTISIDDYLMDSITHEPIYLSEGDTDFSEKLKTFRDEYLELVSMLNARKICMLKILNIICDVQKEYLIGRCDYLKPLDQTMLAESADLSPATVSRLVSGKYISTPRGLLPIQSLLSRRCYKGYSVSHVKHIIRNIENYQKLPDNKISMMLNELGIKISRRTVNKYKNQMLEEAQN
ncbi:hypothetical protein [Salinicoccus halitifaciens]|uniref:RNA polymerase sigma-54 factor n=1 Tax=Salinicoccus halitifaciens TaxID=1073415 RepID=A0ABV2E9J4_9STAP|nr:hypothetical protein [Salinicoccus halitifaciens]MCD2138201.1 hypothetical protein [Salinicoccus halitifaciens]